MAKYKFEWNEQDMCWTVMCPTCGIPVPITNQTYIAIKLGRQGMSCAKGGREHWKVFTKKGEEEIRKEGLDAYKRAKENSCNLEAGQLFRDQYLCSHPAMKGARP